MALPDPGAGGRGMHRCGAGPVRLWRFEQAAADRGLPPDAERRRRLRSMAPARARRETRSAASGRCCSGKRIPMQPSLSGVAQRSQASEYPACEASHPQRGGVTLPTGHRVGLVAEFEARPLVSPTTPGTKATRA
jgi:hypothetical protein